ncbi:helix-turn-helix transcriptional regulator [Protaetiibacter larvae]|uniref:WYL domain-containing protein n=1 Tax=Protaetiibacter larvae TaxID=2592654 RepID=A0A5C1Y695_9MICO|nr:WYL domain-containing protein [Protaetiibacter larvae]QEO08938.1 WYL domain-containing protein [Protaetiibacter larvae]
MKRAERLHALSESLRRSGRRGRSAAQLASEFGVSTRTIKRDLTALENAGLPLWARPGPGGGFGLAPGSTLPPLTLSPAEAMALLAAVAAAPDAPYADLAAKGVAKIVDILDPLTRERAELLARRVWVDHPATASRAVRSAMEQAMTDQRVLRIRYLSKDGVASRRDIEPMLFASRHGNWYLIAWCRLRSAVRWFALDRIQAASVTREACAGHDIREIGAPPETAASVITPRP